MAAVGVWLQKFTVNKVDLKEGTVYNMLSVLEKVQKVVS